MRGYKLTVPATAIDGGDGPRLEQSAQGREAARRQLFNRLGVPTEGTEERGHERVTKARVLVTKNRRIAM